MKQMNVLLQVGDLVVVDPSSVNGGADLCLLALVVHDRIVILSNALVARNTSLLYHRIIVVSNT